MKLNELGISKFGHEELNLDKLVSLAKENCSKALFQLGENKIIYRGVKSITKAGIFNPGNGERKSQNTSNYYTVLFDTNPLNAAWPKRSKSFICTTSLKVSQGYSGNNGTTLVLLPFNNTEIGVCSGADIWFTKINIGKSTDSLVGMNYLFSDIFENTVPKSLKDMQDQLNNNVEHVFKTIEGFGTNDEFNGSDLSEHSKIVKQFADNLENAYAFNKMDGFKLINSSGLGVITGSREVWFSGKAIGIPYTQIEEFKDKL